MWLLLLSLGLAEEPVSGDAPVVEPLVAGPADGQDALLGEWKILGPASELQVLRVIEFSIREAAPSVEEMSAAGLGEGHRRQVAEFRRRLDPSSAEVADLRAKAAAMGKARLRVNRETMRMTVDGVTRESSWQVLSSTHREVQLTLVDAEGRSVATVVRFLDPDTIEVSEGDLAPVVMIRLPQIPASAPSDR